MSEVEAYIESGILELYVLGELSVEEQAKVEAMVEKFPELKQEILAIEIVLEQYALQNSINPDVNLKGHILKSIDESNGVAEELSEPILMPPVKEASVVVINPEKYKSKIKTLRFILAACISLLILSVAALYLTYSQLGIAKDQIFDLKARNEQFTRTVNYLNQYNSDLKAITEMNNDPAWKVLKLAGTPMNPKANMVVYWNVSGKEVMINSSKMYLPPNDKDHQYQLWAIVGGKPVDLGVFDVETEATRLLTNMKAISSAQMFAVTLEKRGGSVSPTMNQMIVAGNVSGTL